jgi:hypothetical protein
MTESLSFEEKVQGLINYYRALERLDPQNPQHIDVANPDVFYWSGNVPSQFLAEARSDVLDNIECHGRIEYREREFAAKDLREDTDELRGERADVLAVMTAPLTPELRQERAKRIAGILAIITSGETVRMTEYNYFNNQYEEPKEVTVDVNRALFGVFRNGHISSRILTVQYDTPVYFKPTDDVEVGEPVFDINVPALFKSHALLFEAVTA